MEVPPCLVLSSIARGQNRDDVRNGGDFLTLASGQTIMVRPFITIAYEGRQASKALREIVAKCRPMCDRDRKREEATERMQVARK